LQSASTLAIFRNFVGDAVGAAVLGSSARFDPREVSRGSPRPNLRPLAEMFSAGGWGGPGGMKWAALADS
jgi:hypothetical protein